MGTLVLYETSAGFCLFRLTDSGKWKDDNVWKSFQTPDAASNLVKLQSIHRFTSTADAVEDLSSLSEGKMSKSLKKFLTEHITTPSTSSKKSSSSSGTDSLLVIDPKLGGTISKKLSIPVISEQTSKSFNDLFRGIRSQLSTLLANGAADGEEELDERDLLNMNLGLSHSLSRFKLKFSPDKVDVMVVQAVSLLDELDKEINVYAMRVKEWYGWHFPEMARLISDPLAYSRVILAMGLRTSCATTDFSTLLPEELESSLKAAAQLSMGTEISSSDLEHIQSLCTQVTSLSSYRTELAEYLRNRMSAIAPNLTALVGELVGARLIAHAGSLVQLAKAPASTVQILGAEKALFRALKTKSDTPKYGLIFHAGLVGQAPTKLKGKMARMVSTKTALSTRLDALADADTKSEAKAGAVGLDARVRLEARLRMLEAGMGITSLKGAARAANGNANANGTRLGAGAGSGGYSEKGDTLIPTGAGAGAAMAVDEEESPRKKEKKEKKEKKRKRAAEEEEEEDNKEGTAVGDVSVATNGHAAEDEDEEDRKERKRRKKEAKAAAKAAATSGGEGVGVGEGEGVGEETPKKEKKKKRKSEA